jgi:hypothetical protein
MGLEVYYPADIRNALLAAEQAAGATAAAAGNNGDDPFAAGFLAGYRAALATLALAFGLTACPEVHPSDRTIAPPTITSPPLSRR